MKKALLAFAFVAGSISFSMAQQGQGGGQQRSPEERAKQQSERLAERLKLSADQKAKVEAIYLAQGKSVDSLRKANEGGDRQQLFQKMQPLREQADKNVAAILTEDQKKEYAKIQEEMRSRMGGGQGGGRRGGQGGGQGTPPPAPGN